MGCRCCDGQLRAAADAGDDGQSRGWVPAVTVGRVQVQGR